MEYSVADLITLFRREVDDPDYSIERSLPNASTFWSNYELIQLLDQAQKIFAEETLCFKDSLSFRPAITEDDPWVNYDPRILRIERAELASNERILPVYTIEDFDTGNYVEDYGIRYRASWESNTGAPNCLVRDLEAGKLRIYPIPTEDDVLKLTVRRLPMEDLTNLGDKLEVPSRWQYGLLNYLRKEAFKKPKAVMAGFGNLIPVADQSWKDFISHAESRIKIRTRGPGQMRYGGL